MTHDPERKLAEVRLGLVLFGGVSLAIYMNGVTNEIFRAVKGRGPYFLLKELLDAEIVVDVVSGASAGGINGIFLGFALANGREFGTCAELWRKDGALSSLLRKTDELAGEVDSILDSQHYQALLTRGFKTMWEGQALALLENPTPVQEMDIFVTGTNFYGITTMQAISSRSSVVVKSHQSLFHLKHRAGRKTQLSPLSDELGRSQHGQATLSSGLLAFGKLAQVTSSFPGAFAPVCLGGEKPNSGDSWLADQKLKTWGALRDGVHYFVDGGVLDNKPFTSTLDAIFYRTTERPVCRHLIYLEPDPEEFHKKKQAEDKTVSPSFVRTIFASTVSLPGYESIAGDLRKLNEHNHTLQRFEALLSLSSVQNTGIFQCQIPARETDPTYIRTCYLGLVQAVWDKLQEDSPELTEVERSARLQTLNATLMNVTSLAPGELAAIDVLYPLRRLMHLSYALHHLESENLRPSSKPLSVEERQSITDLWHYANGQIETLEVIRSQLLGALVPREPLSGATTKPVSGVDYWAWAVKRAYFLLNKAGLDLSDLQAFKLTLQTRRLHGATELGPSASLLPDLLQQHEAAVLKSGIAEAIHAFAVFPAHDRLRYPLELASGLHELDEIHVTRFSPADARRGFCRKDIRDKLTGDEFGHFSAFLKRSWRSNDILWGRLDGVCQLLELLVNETRFVSKKGAELSHLDLAKLRNALGKPSAAKLALLFPNLEKRAGGSKEISVLGNWIDDGPALNDPDTRNKFLNLLTHVAQLDVLCEELPGVLADAAHDQLEWNQYPKASNSKQPEAIRFTPGTAVLDPELIEATVRSLAKGYAEGSSASELSDYFTNRYQIGSEPMSTIPPIIVAALAAQAAVIAEHALVSSGERTRRFVEKNLLYRLIIRTPLRLISGIATTVKNSPSSQRSLILACIGYVALAIAVNILYSDAIYSGGGLGHSFGLVAFAGIPLFLVAFLLLWIRSWAGRIATLLLLVLVASTLFISKHTDSAQKSSNTTNRR